MSYRDAIASFNEKFAVWSVSNVATMACAYIFALIALIALPQAIHDSFAAGFAPLPLVTWLSQSFLQLVLLSVIMVGQTIQGRIAERRSNEQYDAVMELLKDMRTLVVQENQIVSEDEQELVSLAAISASLQALHQQLTK